MSPQRSAALAALLLAAAVPAWATPPNGCFARDYSPEHLAAHPEQVVAAISIEFHPGTLEDGLNAGPGSTVAVLDVTLANQGHVTTESAPEDGFPDGFGGERMYNAFVCEAGSDHCGSPCWGGFDITASSPDGITIRTDGLWVGMGQDCGGFTDLTERPGEPVSYALTRAPASACEED